MPRALWHVFDTCQMFAVEFLCSIFMHGLPVSLKACLFSTMLRIFKPGLQCGLCNGLIPSLTCHRFCPVRSRSALHAAQAAHAVCKVKVFIGVIVTLFSKWPLQWLTMLRWPRHLWPLQTRSEFEDKCSSAILWLNTGSLRSILPFALYILKCCQDAALESVCLQ